MSVVGAVGAKVRQSGNPDAPGVWDESGGRQRSGRGCDSPNADIFFADDIALRFLEIY